MSGAGTSGVGACLGAGTSGVGACLGGERGGPERQGRVWGRGSAWQGPGQGGVGAGLRVGGQVELT